MGETMIKTIIFDLGGVVLTNDWHLGYKDFFKEFTEYFDISTDDMEIGWNLNWPRFRVGGINEDEFWMGFLRMSTRKTDTEHAKKIWRKHQKPLEDMLGLIKKLKNNYRLAVLSNISKEWMDYKREKFGLDYYFDIILGSGFVGVAKPDTRAYTILLEKLNEQPVNCLYIDDREKNTTPARELGMDTILFTGQRKLEKELRRMGIAF